MERRTGRRRVRYRRPAPGPFVFDRNRPVFADAVLERAIAERTTWSDDISGGPRQHDLPAHGITPLGPVVIGMEAKADESFGLLLGDFCAAARRRQLTTRAPERLNRLTRVFFAATLDTDPTLGTLPYQLLSALAGTLAEAKRAGALVCVLGEHTFSTPETDPTAAGAKRSGPGGVRRPADAGAAHGWR